MAGKCGGLAGNRLWSMRKVVRIENKKEAHYCLRASFLCMSINNLRAGNKYEGLKIEHFPFISGGESVIIWGV